LVWLDVHTKSWSTDNIILSNVVNVNVKVITVHVIIRLTCSNEPDWPSSKYLLKIYIVYRYTDIPLLFQLRSDPKWSHLAASSVLLKFDFSWPEHYTESDISWIFRNRNRNRNRYRNGKQNWNRWTTLPSEHFMKLGVSNCLF
jgi:hypothetical protein